MRKIKTMNKKAFLLGEHTLKIIIAVLCILALIYLLFKIYSGYEEDKELEQAKANLGRITDIIENLEEAKEQVILMPDIGFGGVTEGLIKEGNRFRWRIIAWPTQNKDGSIFLPEYCKKEGGGCICMCKIKDIEYIPPDFGSLERSLSSCNDIKTGICRSINRRIIVNPKGEQRNSKGLLIQSQIKIDGPTDIKIYLIKDNEIVMITKNKEDTQKQDLEKIKTEIERTGTEIERGKAQVRERVEEEITKEIT